MMSKGWRCTSHGDGMCSVSLCGHIISSVGRGVGNYCRRVLCDGSFLN